MSAQYQVRVYSTAGVMLAVLDTARDLRTINLEHRVNHVSNLTLSMYGRSDVIQYFTLDCFVEVRRRVQEADLAWYTEFIGFHRTPQDQITTADNQIFTSYCRGLMDLIKRSSIGYYADTVGSAKGPAPCDDVIKEYVVENAGVLALVSNGRVQDHVMPGLVVAADVGLAPTYEGTGAWDNLLDHIRKIGEPNSVDFDVVWGGENDPLTFTFQTYYPQLGSDRRQGTVDPMIFSTTLGNMEDPSYTQQRTEEISSAIVLGPGEGPLRDITLRSSSHVSESPWNMIEQTINASNESIATALDQIGDELIYDKRPAVSFVFQTIQTQQATYGKHYFLGDLVTGTFQTSVTRTADVKIRAVTVNVSGPAERIGLELEQIPE